MATNVLSIHFHHQAEVEMRRALIDRLKRYRSELLTCAFVAQMLASPLADRDPHIGGILAFILVVIMLLGASYMADRRVVRMLVIPLIGIWLIARILEAAGNSRHVYAHLAPVAGLALSCGVLWALIDHFDRLPTVTSSVISEAFISYLVIALVFSQLYWVLSRIIAHPFSQMIPLEQTSTYLYFSMSTLCGVGYGEILPVDPYVRLIAALENMIGIFYVAVVVARLVSSYRPRQATLNSNSDYKEPHIVD